jgi:Ca-activated chloride channel homolog
MVSTDVDPYLTLGVSSDASQDEVKAAYRRAARRLHPDVNRQNPGAVVQFQDITVAYELLIDPNQRVRYDQSIRGKRETGYSFSLRTTPSRRTVMGLEESQVIYLLAEVFPDPNAQQQQQQSRLNLTLVLDRSNSMNGIRLEKVKVAAHKIIDQLTPNDIFSVVSFNDYADVVIPATTVTDKPALKARVSLMAASGGTEIFKGLSAGVAQNRTYLAPKLVNHIILLTDGNTYGDQDQCMALAQKANSDGISISAMGLGQDWNDQFLDLLASSTGGRCEYISTANGVVRFLNDHVRNLSNVFAERMQVSIAPDPDVKLESAFKLAPSPQPLPITDGYIPLGNLQFNRSVSVLFQLEMPPKMPRGFRSLARLVINGDVLANRQQRYQALSDISVEVTQTPNYEETPENILDALGKLTLYRMQERAQEALERGDVQEATRRLENLATRLMELKQPELAHQARTEAQQVAYTSSLSDKGRKALKFQTRQLLLEEGVSDFADDTNA